MTGTWNGRERELWDLYPDEYQAKKIQKILDAVYDCVCLIDKAEDYDTSRENVEPQIYDRLLKLTNELWLIPSVEYISTCPGGQPLEEADCTTCDQYPCKEAYPV